MDQRKLNKVINFFRNKLNEEVPTNALSHGQIAGTFEAGDDPPVKKKRKYITAGPGSRKLWLDYLHTISNGRRS